ncbi:MAG: T9SS type A sorting domain-containing protein [Taibaiella sp.]|nr:T9SS type A sorting domain-containing protein [Taibaiella sp.]
MRSVMIFRKAKYLFYIILLFSTQVSAQKQPVGYWSSLMSYSTAIGVATDGQNLYCISKQAFFTIDTKVGVAIPYSKVNGMSDMGMQNVAYDYTTATVILVYANGNIDLFKDNTFYNIPDFKLKTVAGDKTVFGVYTENGNAYLSTSLGILVIDMADHTIKETYQFYTGNQLLAVNGFAGSGSFYYAITTTGLYKAPKNSLSLQDFQTWRKIDSTHTFASIKAVGELLFLSADTTVYKLKKDSVQVAYTDSDRIIDISPGNDRLYITRYHPFISHIVAIDTNNNVIDSFRNYDRGRQIVQLADNKTWVAYEGTGLARKDDTTNMYYLYPSGPGDVTGFDIYADNGNIYLAHGGYTGSFSALGNQNGISVYENDRWKSYKRDINYPYEPFSDTLKDFVTIAKDETDGTLYAGSFTGGFFELRADGSYKIYKQNSMLDMSIPNANSYQITGTAFDRNNNLWLAMFGSYHELYVREKSTGNWHKFHLEYSRTNQLPYSGGPMVFDEAGNVWYASLGGGGVVGYSTNNTLDDSTDDESYHLTAGKGFGNLPNNATTCIAKDNNDNLWIGTRDGIGILYNASSCIRQRCDVEIPIVQYDKFAGYLFAGQEIRSIAVDGANRKWVGTDNGVWLLSPDAGNSTIINRFTTDNSPLPSNRIQKIAIDKVTGVVYIGTEAGVVTYRGTATGGGETTGKVITYPNPVPSTYRGIIAIKGLTTNADVRITDISGQLVYRTTALGGQAVWNGVDYKGHRPQSGVYLIFATNSDGTQTYAGKMVFMN